MELKFYKRHPDAITPEFKTRGSACFDLAFCARGNLYDIVNAYTEYNAPVSFPVKDDEVYIAPGCRYLIPTGLHLDIPEGYSVRLHPRSGTSLKLGLGLANSEGVVDSDYIDELFLLVINYTLGGVFIKHGDRIAQGELFETGKTTISEIFEKPQQKTDRIGGIGSTGR